jgi:UDP-glucuronate 4-epimerase
MINPVLITGVAGFIGSHVAEHLLNCGERVVGVDNFDPLYDAALKRRNLKEVEETALRSAPHLSSVADGASDSNYEFVNADITDSCAMNELFVRVKPKGVIHFAAKGGVRPSSQDPAGYMHANVTGTSVILDAARRVRDHGCERVVIASSSSVYGMANNVPFREDADVDHPISPYAASKRACEILAFTHHHLTEVPVACLRLFTVFGPRQRPDLAIRRFLSQISQGHPITMFGDGSNSRDYTFIDDIVLGVVRAFDRIPRHKFRTWNLGGSNPVSLADVISTIERVTGRQATIHQKPDEPGDVPRTSADLSRATEELDYQPSTRFEDGVARQWAWMQSGQHGPERPLTFPRFPYRSL